MFAIRKTMCKCLVVTLVLFCLVPFSYSDGRKGSTNYDAFLLRKFDLRNARNSRSVGVVLEKQVGKPDLFFIQGQPRGKLTNTFIISQKPISEEASTSQTVEKSVPSKYIIKNGVIKYRSESENRLNPLLSNSERLTSSHPKVTAFSKDSSTESFSENIKKIFSNSVIHVFDSLFTPRKINVEDFNLSDSSNIVLNKSANQNHSSFNTVLSQRSLKNNGNNSLHKIFNIQNNEPKPIEINGAFQNNFIAKIMSLFSNSRPENSKHNDSNNNFIDAEETKYSQNLLLASQKPILQTNMAVEDVIPLVTVFDEAVWHAMPITTTNPIISRTLHRSTRSFNANDNINPLNFTVDDAFTTIDTPETEITDEVIELNNVQGSNHLKATLESIIEDSIELSALSDLDKETENSILLHQVLEKPLNKGSIIESSTEEYVLNRTNNSNKVATQELNSLTTEDNFPQHALLQTDKDRYENNTTGDYSIADSIYNSTDLTNNLYFNVTMPFFESIGLKSDSIFFDNNAKDILVSTELNAYTTIQDTTLIVSAVEELENSTVKSSYPAIESLTEIENVLYNDVLTTEIYHTRVPTDNNVLNSTNIILTTKTAKPSISDYPTAYTLPLPNISYATRLYGDINVKIDDNSYILSRSLLDKAKLNQEKNMPSGYLFSRSRSEDSLGQNIFNNWPRQYEARPPQITLHEKQKLMYPHSPHTKFLGSFSKNLSTPTYVSIGNAYDSFDDYTTEFPSMTSQNDVQYSDYISLVDSYDYGGEQYDYLTGMSNVNKQALPAEIHINENKKDSLSPSSALKNYLFYINPPTPSFPSKSPKLHSVIKNNASYIFVPSFSTRSQEKEVKSPLSSKTEEILKEKVFSSYEDFSNQGFSMSNFLASKLPLAPYFKSTTPVPQWVPLRQHANSHRWNPSFTKLNPLVKLKTNLTNIPTRKSYINYNQFYPQKQNGLKQDASRINEKLHNMQMPLYEINIIKTTPVSNDNKENKQYNDLFYYNSFKNSAPNNLLNHEMHSPQLDEKPNFNYLPNTFFIPNTSELTFPWRYPKPSSFNQNNQDNMKPSSLSNFEENKSQIHSLHLSSQYIRDPVKDNLRQSNKNSKLNKDDVVNEHVNFISYPRLSINPTLSDRMHHQMLDSEDSEFVLDMEVSTSPSLFTTLVPSIRPQVQKLQNLLVNAAENVLPHNSSDYEILNYLIEVVRKGTSAKKKEETNIVENVYSPDNTQLKKHNVLQLKEKHKGKISTSLAPLSFSSAIINPTVSNIIRPHFFVNVDSVHNSPTSDYSPSSIAIHPSFTHFFDNAMTLSNFAASNNPSNNIPFNFYDNNKQNFENQNNNNNINTLEDSEDNINVDNQFYDHNTLPTFTMPQLTNTVKIYPSFVHQEHFNTFRRNSTHGHSPFLHLKNTPLIDLVKHSYPDASNDDIFSSSVSSEVHFFPASQSPPQHVSKTNNYFITEISIAGSKFQSTHNADFFPQKSSSIMTYNKHIFPQTVHATVTATTIITNKPFEHLDNYLSFVTYQGDKKIFSYPDEISKITANINNGYQGNLEGKDSSTYIPTLESLNTNDEKVATFFNNQNKNQENKIQEAESYNNAYLKEFVKPVISYPDLPYLTTEGNLPLNNLTVNWIRQQISEYLASSTTLPSTSQMTTTTQTSKFPQWFLDILKYTSSTTTTTTTTETPLQSIDFIPTEFLNGLYSQLNKLIDNQSSRPLWTQLLLGSSNPVHTILRKILYATKGDISMAMDVLNALNDTDINNSTKNFMNVNFNKVKDSFLIDLDYKNYTTITNSTNTKNIETVLNISSDNETYDDLTFISKIKNKTSYNGNHGIENELKNLTNLIYKFLTEHAKGLDQQKEKHKETLKPINLGNTYKQEDISRTPPTVANSQAESPANKTSVTMMEWAGYLASALIESPQMHTHSSIITQSSSKPEIIINLLKETLHSLLSANVSSEITYPSSTNLHKILYQLTGNKEFSVPLTTNNKFSANETLVYNNLITKLNNTKNNDTFYDKIKPLITPKYPGSSFNKFSLKLNDKKQASSSYLLNSNTFQYTLKPSTVIQIPQFTEDSLSLHSSYDLSSSYKEDYDENYYDSDFIYSDYDKEYFLGSSIQNLEINTEYSFPSIRPTYATKIKTEHYKKPNLQVHPTLRRKHSFTIIQPQSLDNNIHKIHPLKSRPLYAHKSSLVSLSSPVTIITYSLLPSLKETLIRTTVTVPDHATSILLPAGITFFSEEDYKTPHTVTVTVFSTASPPVTIVTRISALQSVPSHYSILRPHPFPTRVKISSTTENLVQDKIAINEPNYLIDVDNTTFSSTKNNDSDTKNGNYNKIYEHTQLYQLVNKVLALQKMVLEILSNSTLNFKVPHFFTPDHFSADNFEDSTTTKHHNSEANYEHYENNYAYVTGMPETGERPTSELPIESPFLVSPGFNYPNQINYLLSPFLHKDHKYGSQKPTSTESYEYTNTPLHIGMQNTTFINKISEINGWASNSSALQSFMQQLSEVEEQLGINKSNSMNFENVSSEKDQNLTVLALNLLENAINKLKEKYKDTTIGVNDDTFNIMRDTQNMLHTLMKNITDFNVNKNNFNETLTPSLVLNYTLTFGQNGFPFIFPNSLKHSILPRPTGETHVPLSSSEEMFLKEIINEKKNNISLSNAFNYSNTYNLHKEPYQEYDKHSIYHTFTSDVYNPSWDNKPFPSYNTSYYGNSNDRVASQQMKDTPKIPDGLLVSDSIGPGLYYDYYNENLNKIKGPISVGGVGSEYGFLGVPINNQYQDYYIPGSNLAYQNNIINSPFLAQSGFEETDQYSPPSLYLPNIKDHYQEDQFNYANKVPQNTQQPIYHASWPTEQATENVLTGVYTCNDFGSAKISNFLNPSYPLPDRGNKRCNFRLHLTDPNTCQVRVDFVDTSMLLPVKGICTDQVLKISGTVKPLSVNSFCGKNKDQHSPPGCLQYYTGKSGTVKSFNYEGGQYLSNMNYRICLKKLDNSCELGLSAFDGHFGLQKLNSKYVPHDRAGVGPRACIRDYIYIPGLVAISKNEVEAVPGGDPTDVGGGRVCGGKLSYIHGDAFSRLVLSRVSGSIYALYVKTGEPLTYNSITHGPGFEIRFTQRMKCLSEESLHGGLADSSAGKAQFIPEELEDDVFYDEDYFPRPDVFDFGLHNGTTYLHESPFYFPPDGSTTTLSKRVGLDSNDLVPMELSSSKESDVESDSLLLQKVDSIVSEVLSESFPSLESLFRAPVARLQGEWAAVHENATSGVEKSLIPSLPMPLEVKDVKGYGNSYIISILQRNLKNEEKPDLPEDS